VACHQDRNEKQEWECGLRTEQHRTRTVDRVHRSRLALRRDCAFNRIAQLNRNPFSFSSWFTATTRIFWRRAKATGFVFFASSIGGRWSGCG